MEVGRWMATSVRAAIVLAIALVLPATASAKDCGGDVACACGDTVRSTAVLTADLVGCKTGLRVKGAATLDCAGHALVAMPLGAAEGIIVEGTGATVRRCTLAGFKTGIRVRAGGGNHVLDNDVLDSGRYGIELAVATTGNEIARNLVDRSGDEGIHVGTGADGNVIADNDVRASKKENLSLLDVTGCTVSGNRLSGGGAAAMYVKHSSRNVFTDNEVASRPIQVRGESDDNVFTGNHLDGVAFLFQAYKDAKRGWKAPRRNQINGGAVMKVETCFRFDGASYNVAGGIAVDRCKAMAQKKAGGLTPVGNTVTVVRE